MTEYYMFMYGANSCVIRSPPFLVPVDKVSQVHIDRFLDLLPDDDDQDYEDGVCDIHSYFKKYSVKSIPSEFGKSQIIKAMIFGIEQESGGLIIDSNGKRIDQKPSI